jgi:transcriptional regulator with XRE-family HTH domain
MGFRENLKSQLLYADMPVKELAVRSGVKKGTLDSYLQAEGYTPAADTAVRIAQALGVSVEYLVTGKELEKTRPISSLPEDIQAIVRTAEHLHANDRRIILTLAGLLKTR